MLALLKWLFIGHEHKWKIIDQGPFTIMDGEKIVEHCQMYVLQCEHCGNIKRKKV